MHIGDYVDYKNPTSGTYTITAEKSGLKNTEINYDQTYDVSKNQLNWRVLGIDEETEGLKLIAGSPMKLNDIPEIPNKQDPFLYSVGAEIYVYGPDEMDKACSMYKNEYALEARSVNMEDINEVLEIKTEEQIKEYNALSIILGVTKYGEEYGPFENQYTPETWLNGKQTTTVEGKTTGYAFLMGEQIDGQQVKTLDIANTRAKAMLFYNVEAGHGKSYWIASRGVYAYSEKNCVGLALGAVVSGEGMITIGLGYDAFRSDGSGYDYRLSVRPVVSLKPDITKNEIPKIPDKTEEIWNYN